MEVVEFEGKAIFLGTGIGELSVASNGDREWMATCGCSMTSGGGAYGTFGSAYAIEVCDTHKVEEERI